MEAAERLERQWIGCDLSPMAVKLVKSRLNRYFSDDGKLIPTGFQIIHRTDIPVRTDIESTPITKSHREKMYADQKEACNGCEEWFPLRNLETDHIVPRSKGGGDNAENFQLLCGYCNRVKGSGTHEKLKATLKERGIMDKPWD